MTAGLQESVCDRAKGEREAASMTDYDDLAHFVSHRVSSSAGGGGRHRQDLTTKRQNIVRHTKNFTETL